MDQTDLNTPKPDDIMTHGYQLYQKGEPQKAAEVFASILSEHPDSIEAYLNIGASRLAAKQHDLAAEAFKAALAIDSENPNAVYGLAMSYEAAGDRIASLPLFQRAAGLNPRSAKMWMSLAEITSDPSARSKAIESAVTAAKEDFKANHQSFASAMRTGNIFEQAHYLADAQRAYATAISIAPSSRLARAKSSLCFYKAQDFLNAADANRSTIMNCDIPETSNDDGSSFTKLAEHTLVKIHDILQRAGVSFFLVAGTLLGCIRNNAPLPHDRDVDIGIPEKMSASTIMEAFRGDPEFSVPVTYSDDDILFYVYHQHMPIDIFRHETIDNWMWCGLSRDTNDMKWRYSRFKLTPLRIIDREFLVPAPTAIYLKENYGDWETPQVAYSSVLSSPARFHVSTDVLRYFAHSRLSMALHKRKPDVLRAVIRQTPSFIRNDAELMDRVMTLSAQK